MTGFCQSSILQFDPENSSHFGLEQQESQRSSLGAKSGPAKVGAGIVAGELPLIVEVEVSSTPAKIDLNTGAEF